MSEVRDDITWTATITAFRKDIEGRRNRVKRSLEALQNKDSLYASEHRRAIRLYADVLDVIDRHEKK